MKRVEQTNQLFKHLLLNVLYNLRTTTDAFHFICINSKCYDVSLMVKLTPFLLDPASIEDKPKRISVKTTTKLLTLFPNIETVRIYDMRHLDYLFDRIRTLNIVLHFSLRTSHKSPTLAMLNERVVQIKTMTFSNMSFSPFPRLRSCVFHCENLNSVQFKELVATYPSLQHATFRLFSSIVISCCDILNQVSERKTVICRIMNHIVEFELKHIRQHLDTTIVITVPSNSREITTRHLVNNDAFVLQNKERCLPLSVHSQDVFLLQDMYLFDRVRVHEWFCSEEVSKRFFGLDITCVQFENNVIAGTVTLSESVTKIVIDDVQRVENIGKLQLLELETKKIGNSVLALSKTLTRLVLDNVDVRNVDLQQLVRLKQLVCKTTHAFFAPAIQSLTAMTLFRMQKVTFARKNKIVNLKLWDVKSVNGFSSLQHMQKLSLNEHVFRNHKQLLMCVSLVRVKMHRMDFKGHVVMLPPTVRSLKIKCKDITRIADFDKIAIEDLYLVDCRWHHLQVPSTVTFLVVENVERMRIVNLIELRIPTRVKDQFK